MAAWMTWASRDGLCSGDIEKEWNAEVGKGFLLFGQVGLSQFVETAGTLEFGDEGIDIGFELVIAFFDADAPVLRFFLV